ncbi:MAG: hypothetical protein ACOCWL_01155 [Thermoguttaceae bacterium]
MPNPEAPKDVVEVARQLATALEERGQSYALGGAIALGYWGVPRGTIDVDLTLFLSAEHPGECIRLLQEIGCEVAATEAVRMIGDHGFCRGRYAGFRIDVFLPINRFYDIARRRRRRVDLEGQPVMVWDAESLVVFKMMFFREKDLVDIRQILRTQGSALDGSWVEEQLTEIFGRRDPRVARWQELRFAEKET